MTEEKKQKIIDKAKRTKNDYQDGYLKAERGYKFRTRAFLEVVFLYINGVDGKNPDILGKFNKNTFVNEAKEYIEKIKEQIRLDIKDLNFIVSGASTLGRYIPKAANRKMLEDNNFAEILDDVPDNAADYGSGYLKIWKSGKKMKAKSIDPFAMVFNQWNFKEGLKMERIRHSRRWYIENEKYDAAARLELQNETTEEEMEKDLVCFQVTEDLKDGGQAISIVDLENERVYYHYESPEVIVWYFKFDFQKRKGFPDALGIGCYERVFNKLVQSKVNRERLDRVLQVASVLPFQKQMDNERDNYAGKEVLKLKTSSIIGHKGNKIEPLDTGGSKQAALIRNELNDINGTIGNDVNVSEALSGNTLPSGTSGILGNLLSENSSSVLKEVKKKYAEFISQCYKIAWTPYLLSIFDNADNLKDFLDPNDIKLIERNVINFLVAQKQIDAAINDLPFDPALAREEVKREIKNKPLISGDLLEQLREEVVGIRTFISGEKVSKAQSVAFLRELRTTYQANPDLFKDPFYVEVLKKEAAMDSGIDGIEIDNLLKEIA